MKYTLFCLGILLILTACGLDEQSVEQEPEVNLASSISGEKEEVDAENTWIDVTTLQEGVKYDMPTNAKDFISQKNDSFQAVPEQTQQHLQEIEHGDLYYYYLESMGIKNGLNVIQVEGVAINKDFRNIESLAAIIQEEQHKRGEHLDPGEYSKNKMNIVKDWKAPSERMIKAVDYLQKLLNDLDIAINQEGDGYLYGYSYQADGKKTDELDTFILGDLDQDQLQLTN